MEFRSLPGQLILLAVVLLLAALAFAAPPQTINYQGYLKNANGTPVNTATNLTFSIYSSTSGAGAVWSEQKSITPDNGVYNTLLGTATPLTLGFGRQFYLGIKVASDPEMRPLQPLSSVPSAYRAALADSVLSNSIGTGAIADGSVTAAKLDTAYVKRDGDTMTGTLNISSGNLALSATSATGGIIYSGGSPFIHGFGTYNFFAGSGSGNLTMAGSYNTAIGGGALAADTTGSFNAASGLAALMGNTKGDRNSASGAQALKSNTEGNRNTALGFLAGDTLTTANSNTTGSDNTFIGAFSGPGTPTQLTNATAIGANALVSASNSMVLGGTGANAVKVGIGTETPSESLDVVGNLKANSFISTVATGTPPLQVSSTTLVNNLNAEMVGGKTLAGLDQRYIDPTSPVPTMQQIATLRWDQVRGSSATTDVSTGPTAMAFDGSSIWVANSTSSSVMKINPANGAVSQTISLGTGTPTALAFDGSSLWVTNMTGSSVMKINPVTGAVGPPITVGAGPTALAFDGSNIWVANYWGSSVMKINPTTGVVGSPTPVDAGPWALAFDGSSIWVANLDSSSVMKINPATGEVIQTISIGGYPKALAFDGSSVWVALWSSSVKKINPVSGDVTQAISLGTGTPTALVFDGSSLWVTNSTGNSVMKISTATGAVAPPISVGTNPSALAFDGNSIWVANYDSNTVMKLVAAGQPVGVQAVGTMQMNDAAVTSTKIADGAVSTADIADGAVTAAKIADYQVLTSKLASNAVTTTIIANGAVTIAKIADNAVTTAKIADGAVTIAKIADGAVTAAKLDTQYAPASAIAPPVQFPRSNTITTVDSIGDVGPFTSITIGTDGLPVISYYDGTHADLKVAKCGNSACSSGNTITTIDSGPYFLGFYTSITIGSDGLPVISFSFYDGTDYDLKVAKCGNSACSSGTTITTVNPGGSLAYYSSITIGSDGLPVISYRDNTNYDLKVAKCGNAACSSGNSINTVDNSVGNVGGFSSITIGSDGLPVISYLDDTNGDLKVAKCVNATCSGTATVITTVDSGVRVGLFPSITIGSDGLPVISYYDDTNSNLKVAKCTNAACSGTATVITTVDNSGDVGQTTSITIGSDGLPVISYYDSTNSDLKVAKCANAACSGTATVTTVDDGGGYSSITIGSDGLPVISYYDSTNGDLKVLKCTNPFCLNNWIRR